MRSGIRATIAWLIMTLPGGAIQADLLSLADGTRLVGSIERITATEVRLTDTFAGALDVPRDKIVAVETDAPLTFPVGDGTFLTGRLAPAETDGALMLDIDGIGPHPLALADIRAAFRGDPRPEPQENPGIEFSAEGNVGVTLSRGNSESDNLSVDGRLVARTPRNRYTLSGQFIREESAGVLVKENWRSLVKYDYFISDRWFWFNSASFESDEFADLNLRTALAAGMGYQFFEGPDRSLSVELGPSYVDENFITAEDDSFLGSRWAVNFEQRVREGLTFFHFNDGLLGLESTDQLTIRSRTGLRLHLTERIIARVQTAVKWDRAPPEGTDSTDVEHSLTIGVRL